MPYLLPVCLSLTIYLTYATDIYHPSIYVSIYVSIYLCIVQDNQRRLHEDNCRKLKSMMPALKKAETYVPLCMHLSVG